MHEGGKGVIGKPVQAGAAPLDYALPDKRRHHSVWSVIGFGLAGVCLVGAAVPWWHVLTSGATSMRIGISPLGFAIPCLPICLCLIGLRRGRKFFAIAGIVMAVISVVAMIVIVAGSPW